MKNKNGIVYLINAIIFVILMYSELRGGFFITGCLTVGLIASYFLFESENSKSNILKMGSFELVHLNGFILFFLFSLNLVLSWRELALVETMYVIVFCCIQLLSIKIRKVKYS